MVLFELWGVGIVVGGREDPVPPSPLRLVEFFQPAHLLMHYVNVVCLGGYLAGNNFKLHQNC